MCISVALALHRSPKIDSSSSMSTDLDDVLKLQPQRVRSRGINKLAGLDHEGEDLTQHFVGSAVSRLVSKHRSSTCAFIAVFVPTV